MNGRIFSRNPRKRRKTHHQYCFMCLFVCLFVVVLILKTRLICKLGFITKLWNLRIGFRMRGNARESSNTEYSTFQKWNYSPQGPKKDWSPDSHTLHFILELTRTEAAESIFCLLQSREINNPTSPSPSSPPPLPSSALLRRSVRERNNNNRADRKETRIQRPIALFFQTSKARWKNDG